MYVYGFLAVYLAIILVLGNVCIVYEFQQALELRNTSAQYIHTIIKDGDIA